MASFRVIKDVSADVVSATTYNVIHRDFDLVFIGSYTKTVPVTFSQIGNLCFLGIPPFVDNAVNISPTFNSQAPSWMPLPKNVVSVDVDLFDASLEVNGRLKLSNAGVINIFKYVVGNYTGQCGPATGFTLVYFV